jgi:hypothetical protein
MAGDDGVGVHLLEDRPFVFELFAGNDLQSADLSFCVFALVGLDIADDYVLIAFVLAPRGFRKHQISLADTRRESEKQLEPSASFGPFLFLDPRQQLFGGRAARGLVFCCHSLLIRLYARGILSVSEYGVPRAVKKARHLRAGQSFHWVWQSFKRRQAELA